MGQHSCRTINDNAERLVEYCVDNSCMIGGTIFRHKDIHKLSWRSPDGHTVNQIDHVIVNRKWWRSLQDFKVHRGADVGSDHHLVIAQVRLKLRATPTTKQRRKVFDSNKRSKESLPSQLEIASMHLKMKMTMEKTRALLRQRGIISRNCTKKKQRISQRLQKEER